MATRKRTTTKGARTNRTTHTKRRRRTLIVGFPVAPNAAKYLQNHLKKAITPSNVDRIIQQAKGQPLHDDIKGMNHASELRTYFQTEWVVAAFNHCLKIHSPKDNCPIITKAYLQHVLKHNQELKVLLL